MRQARSRGSPECERISWLWPGGGSSCRHSRGRSAFGRLEKNLMPSPDRPVGSDTDELTTPEQQPRGPSAALGRVRLDSAALSHPGMVRTSNEDHYLVAKFG